MLAKAALAEGFESIHVFEQRGDIGGAWYLSPSSFVDGRLYTTETSEPPCIPCIDAFTIDPPHDGVPPTFISPMYTNLWANTPRDVMTFAEKPFPKGTTDFPFRTQILEYLKEYGDAVKGLVEFNKEVDLIEKHENLWGLTIRDLSDASRKTSIKYFDAVAVASGSMILLPI